MRNLNNIYEIIYSNLIVNNVKKKKGFTISLKKKKLF